MSVLQAVFVATMIIIVAYGYYLLRKFRVFRLKRKIRRQVRRKYKHLYD